MLGDQQIHFNIEMPKFKKVVVFLALIPTNTECKLVSKQVKSNSDSQILITRRVKRVVGGENSNHHEFPWMVALVYVYHSKQIPTIG